MAAEKLAAEQRAAVEAEAAAAALAQAEADRKAGGALWLAHRHTHQLMGPGMIVTMAEHVDRVNCRLWWLVSFTMHCMWRPLGHAMML